MRGFKVFNYDQFYSAIWVKDVSIDALLISIWEITSLKGQNQRRTASQSNKKPCILTKEHFPS